MPNAAERIAGLSPQQIRHLAARLGKSRRDVAPVRLDRRGRVVFPLSFTQERMWFLERASGGERPYNLSVATRIRAPIDTDLIGRALDELAARHELLHTTFPVIDGQPMQRVEPLRPQRVDLLDLRTHAPESRLAIAGREVTRQTREPYDLERGPFLRCTVVRLDDSDHIVAIATHHLIVDAWSLSILLQELTRLYMAAAVGTRVELRPLDFQFADFAAWERERLAGPELDRLLSFWTTTLRGAPRVELPADRPRPPEVSYRGATEPIVIPLDLAERMRALKQELNVSSFAASLTVFLILLQRYTRQDDLVVGVPVANRTRSEFDGVVGPFVNTIVMRASLAGNPTFRELVGRVWQSCVQALEHQTLPFERLVMEVNPARDLSRTPIHQIVFHFEDRPPVGRHDDEVVADLMPLDKRSVPALYDLEWCLWDEQVGFFLQQGGARPEAGGGTSGSVTYSTDLFEPETVRRMIRQYVAALECVVTDPDVRLADVTITGESERAQIEAWSRGAAAVDAEPPIGDQFLAQVRSSPDAIALTCGSEQLTYATLARRAATLARRLEDAGVGPESLVAVSLERSIDLVVAVVAVWQTGGAFMTIDPALPAARLAYLRDDARPDVLVASRAGGPWPDWSGQVLHLDDVPERAHSEPTPRAVPVSAANAAYVIYTSGSTGRPKGVVVTHGSFAQLVACTRRRFGLGIGDRVLQFASTSFDASVWEITMALGAGAALVLPASSSAPLGGESLTELIDRDAVTTVLLPPSVLAVSPWRELPALRLLIAGGEACALDLVRRWAPGRRFVNAYGPTENTVVATMATCLPTDDDVLIGSPFAATRTYVVDEGGAWTPPGVVGELLLGGPMLARGYLGRPGLTAERFVPDPFAGVSGARAYRTGDLAQWRPSGLLRFLGRADHQVKLHGYRIEPAEIDAALSRSPGVERSVTVLRRDTSGNDRLVAYVVPKAGCAIDSDTLKAMLAAQLPAYMIPSFLVTLDELPITSSGKLDRAALPDPLTAARTQAPAAPVAPRSDLERVILEAWREVLAVDHVGVHDNFFEVGGTSLLLIRVHTVLQERIGRTFPLLDLMRHPTVASAAQCLHGGAPADDRVRSGQARAKARHAAMQRRQDSGPPPAATP
ncbi:MAG: non-ribosomal peptide synthetase [Vicinamibacterales bacterium]